MLKKGYTKKAVEMKDEGRDEKERSSGSNLKTGIGVGRNKTAAVGPTGKKTGEFVGKGDRELESDLNGHRLQPRPNLKRVLMRERLNGDTATPLGLD